MDPQAKREKLEELRATVSRLEAELAAEAQPAPWTPPSFYIYYHVLAGFVLGVFGAATSLLFNIVGSLMVGQYPLHLIRVYLTFPLGESALRLGQGTPTLDDNLALTIGCCLYLGTGMLLGIPFHLMLRRWFATAGFLKRFLAVSGLALLLWLVNFYAILSWLQPWLFGGNWIVQLIPPWVAAMTHLVFGWTMLLVEPLGTFAPFRRQVEA